VDVLPRHADVVGAAGGVDVVVIATPDDAIASVAAAVRPVDTTVVCHLSGRCGLDVLSPHLRRASVHPLVSLPDVETGAARLAAGGHFAVDGDPFAGRLVAALGGAPLAVAPERRALYHAAACVASNHLVVLAAQVERLAALAGVPAAAFWELMSSTLENVVDRGPAAALTGPAARGDEETVAAHLAALPPQERALYEVLSASARRLGREHARRQDAGLEPVG
jgi:predicted short-subunit dehydrogenase-like oxidoreductase (DUF2520 family)